jgi:hypothetical protein
MARYALRRQGLAAHAMPVALKRKAPVRPTGSNTRRFSITCPHGISACKRQI